MTKSFRPAQNAKMAMGSECSNHMQVAYKIFLIFGTATRAFSPRERHGSTGQSIMAEDAYPRRLTMRYHFMFALSLVSLVLTLAPLPAFAGVADCYDGKIEC